MSQKLFDDELAPLLRKIELICSEHEIPFVVCFELDQPEDDNTILFAGASQLTEACSGRIRLLARLAETPAIEILSSLVAGLDRVAKTRTVD